MIESAYIDGLQIHPTATYAIEAFAIGSPAPRVASLVRPVDHGTTDATRFYGARVLDLVGTVTADTMADLWAAIDDLKAALSLGTERVLVFRRDGLTFDERVVVRVESPVDIPISASNVNPFLRWGVTLLAPDPRIYSATENEAAYDPTEAGSGGLAFPLDFPLVFGATDADGRLTADNEGTIATPFVATITGPVTNPILDNDSTGESLYFQDLELASGEIIVVDVKARTVLLGGTTSRPDLIDPSLTDWFYLAPGVNQLRLRGSDMVATETELSIVYRNARI